MWVQNADEWDRTRAKLGGAKEIQNSFAEGA